MEKDELLKILEWSTTKVRSLIPYSANLPDPEIGRRLLLMDAGSADKKFKH